MQRPWGRNKSGAFEKKRKWLEFIGQPRRKCKEMGSERRVGPGKPSVQHLAAVTAVAVMRINGNQAWRETVCWFNEANVKGDGSLFIHSEKRSLSKAA